MHLKRLLLFLLIALLPSYIYGQTKTYKLLGVAQTDGFSYMYALVFDVNKTSITGYSITKQPNGAEFKAEVKGQIDRKKHTITFTETKKLDRDPHKNMTICFFSGELTYKLLGEKYIVSGPFSGRDLDNKLCSKGTMIFEDRDVPGNVFYKKKTPPPIAPPVNVPKQDTVQKEPALPENTITAGVQKQIEWHSDSCLLQIWDGGVIDGDVVSVLLNGKPLITKYTLVKAKKQLRFPVPKGANIITIVAEDEGTNPPNTANITLWDGDTYYKLTAYNKVGAKALIVLKKQ